MNKSLVYIDTDVSLGTPGAEIDDGAALFMLLQCPEIEIAGIGTVFGNVPVNDAFNNLIRMLHLLGRQTLPATLGAGSPLSGNLDWFREWQAGYAKTIPFENTPPQQSSTEFLIDLVHANPGQITILSIGPLTNLAKALVVSPDIARQVKRVIAMGGSFGSPLQGPEFNIRCDPDAARTVFEADWPLVLLGLELTRQIPFTRQDFLNLPTQQPAVRLFREQAEGWINRVESMGWEKGGCSLHDAVAAAYLLRPDLFSGITASIQVSPGGEYPKGTTIFMPSGKGSKTVEVITQVNIKQCKELIWSFIDQSFLNQEEAHG
jgi:purine nucleosidase